MFKKFSKIKQFRETMNEIINSLQYCGRDENNNPIYDKSIKLPTINCYGTIKIDGTNIGISEYGHKRFIQSREKYISETTDIYDAFHFFMKDHKQDFDNIFNQIYDKYGYDENFTYYIYGEYFGKGISGHKSAISELDHKYIIFDVEIITDKNIIIINDEDIKRLIGNDIFNVHMFDTYNIDINLNNLHEASNKLTQLVQSIEHQCPVGKYFSSTGDCEGIVWKTMVNKKIYLFKTKSQKFSVTNKNRTKTKIDIEPEIINSVKEFINYAVTNNRLDQGLNVICQNNITSDHIKPFVNWVISDIFSEEIDVINNNNLPVKLLRCEIANIARKFIINKLNI